MSKVSVSTTLRVPADEVWDVVGGWNALPDWHPEVERSTLDRGGHLRRLRLAGGTELTEKLEKFDSGERTYTYSITACPLPFSNYVSTIRVREEEGACTIEWSSTFTPTGAPETDVAQSLKDFYQAGFDNLRKLLTR